MNTYSLIITSLIIIFLIPLVGKGKWGSIRKVLKKEKSDQTNTTSTDSDKKEEEDVEKALKEQQLRNEGRKGWAWVVWLLIMLSALVMVVSWVISGVVGIYHDATGDMMDRRYAAFEHQKSVKDYRDNLIQRETEMIPPHQDPFRVPGIRTVSSWTAAIEVTSDGKNLLYKREDQQRTILVIYRLKSGEMKGPFKVGPGSQPRHHVTYGDIRSIQLCSGDGSPLNVNVQVNASASLSHLPLVQ